MGKNVTDKLLSGFSGCSGEAAIEYAYVTGPDFYRSELRRNQQSHKDVARNYVPRPGERRGPRFRKIKPRYRSTKRAGAHAPDQSQAATRLARPKLSLELILDRLRNGGVVDPLAVDSLLSQFCIQRCFVEAGVYDKRYMRGLTRSLYHLCSIEIKHHAVFQQYITEIFGALSQQLACLKKVHPGQLANLVYILSRFSVDWSEHADLSDTLDRFFDDFSWSVTLKNDIDLLKSYMQLLGSYARWMHARGLSEDTETIEKMDAVFLSVEKRITALCKQHKAIFSREPDYAELRCMHLFWQYCAWRFDSNIYKDKKHRTVINYLASVMDKKFYTLDDDANHNALYDISNIESRVVTLIEGLLQPRPHLKLNTQKTVGCYALDVCFPDQEIVMEVYGPHHYTSDGDIRPQDVFRNALLEKLGWTVIVLDVDDIASRNNRELTAHLSTVLQEAVEAKGFSFAEQTPRYKPPHRRRGQSSTGRGRDRNADSQSSLWGERRQASRRARSRRGRAGQAHRDARFSRQARR